MADITRQLSESAQVVLGADGAGTVRLGPRMAGVRWLPRTVAVRCDVLDTEMPRFTLWLGGVGADQLGSTYTGAADSTDVSLTLHSGQYLVGEWAGGAPGAVATMSVVGETISTR